MKIMAQLVEEHWERRPTLKFGLQRGRRQCDASSLGACCNTCGGREGAWALRCTTMRAACTHMRARAPKQTQSSASVPPSTAPSRACGHGRCRDARDAREHSDRMRRLVWWQDSSGDEEQAAAAGSVHCAPPPEVKMAAARGAADGDASMQLGACDARGRGRGRGRYRAQRPARCEHIFPSSAHKQTQSSADVPVSTPGGIAGDVPTVRSARAALHADTSTARMFTRARMAVPRNPAACVNTVATDRGGTGEPRSNRVRGR